MEWARLLHGVPAGRRCCTPSSWRALSDDLNTPAAFAVIARPGRAARDECTKTSVSLKRALTFLGVYNDEKGRRLHRRPDPSTRRRSKTLIAKRNAARKAKNFAEADRLRGELSAMGVAIEDAPAGTTWKVVS